ncbi:hypothetical protein SO802_003929 [Lithocarpus litseifolius]|uniref:Uncharacterized protein n=1 Tax=Lithocarpus litseifolius TaxID=425828 RepID=A0AAW2E1G8_9ROSI
MITRSNLAEQLREYQIRSKHDWASVSFFSSTTNLPSSSSGTNFYHGESLKEYMPCNPKGCGALVRRTLGRAVKPGRLGFEQPCVHSLPCGHRTGGI